MSVPRTSFTLRPMCSCKSGGMIGCNLHIVNMLATVYGGTKVETQSKLVVSSNRNPMALNKREAISEVPTAIDSWHYGCHQ